MDLCQYLGHKKVKSDSERHPFMDGPVSSETSQEKSALNSFRWTQEMIIIDVVPPFFLMQLALYTALPIAVAFYNESPRGFFYGCTRIR